MIEKLYRLRWGVHDGVGSIIISPTKELAGQLFQELRTVGKHHNLSAGLLIGGRKDVETEKERVNSMNILICTPGRLLQHMDETPNFDCSQLQVHIRTHSSRCSVDAGLTFLTISDFAFVVARVIYFHFITNAGLIIYFHSRFHLLCHAAGLLFHY